MKNFNYLLLFLLLLNGNLFSQIKYESLKPGDWFDCEMEFENGMPVFRNHWIPDSLEGKFEQLISIRFTFKGKESNSAYKWKYKILRYRRIIKPTTTKAEIHNIKIFDTWYPSYLDEEFEDIRNTLTGSFVIAEDSIYQHNYSYYNQTFVAQRVLTNEKNKLSSTVNPITDYYISQAAEKTAKLLLLTKQFEKQYSVWFLPNGLPYAFSDINKQKVYTIPNACFSIPNEAVLNIINNRIDTIQRGNIDHNYLNISLDNPAHVINSNEIPDFIDISSSKTSISLKLKCGAAIHLGSGFLLSKIFIEPGDTIDIVLTPDIYNSTIIRGNKNSIWWSSIKNRPNKNELNKAPITKEFKSYLKLYYKSKETTKALITRNNIDYLTKSSLPFVYLKSYNYSFFRNNYLQTFSFTKNTYIRSLGGFMDYSFRSNVSNAIANYKHYFQYYYLYSTLTKYSCFRELRKNPEEFRYFMNQCGDSLLRKKIKDLLDGYNSIQPGQILPFTSILDEHKAEVSILPKKKQYTLMLINNLIPYDKNFFNLIDSLPDDIETINCSVKRLFHNYNPQIKNPIPERLGNTNINVHPLMFKKFKSILNGNSSSLMILYDKKGEILYSKLLYRIKYVDKHYVKKHKEQILNAIETNKTKNKSDFYDILLKLALTLTISIILATIIYKIRIQKLKRRNEQEKMIQQLKLKSIQSQLNPHFLFNALNSIQNLINSNNTQQANKYLIGFSDLLRGVLKNADKPLVPLTDELNLIERYCELEKLRVDFDCNIVANTQTLAELIEVPYMLLQPIIENAIKHGVAKMGEKGQLRIEISEADSSLYIRVIDNGQGFGDNNLKQLTLKGKGLKITIDKLKSIYNEDAELTISNNTTQGGGGIQIKLKIG